MFSHAHRCVEDKKLTLIKIFGEINRIKDILLPSLLSVDFFRIYTVSLKTFIVLCVIVFWGIRVARLLMYWSAHLPHTSVVQCYK